MTGGFAAALLDRALWLWRLKVLAQLRTLVRLDAEVALKVEKIGLAQAADARERQNRTKQV